MSRDTLTRAWTFSRHYGARLSLLQALIGPLLVTAVLVPFRTTFTGAAAALALVVVVVAAAVGGTRGAGIVATLSSALCFDFLLTLPYDRFEISRRGDVETTVALVVVGLVVTALAERARRYRRSTNEGADYIALIAELGELAASSAPPEDLIAQASAALVDLLALRGCRFEATATVPPLARLLGSGEVVHVGLLWPASEIGIPGPESEIALEWRGRSVGRFVLTPTRGRPVSTERRVEAVALSRVVAAALGRAGEVV